MQDGSSTTFSARALLVWHISLGVFLLVAWELIAFIYDARWISRPSLVLRKLGTWIIQGDLHVHLTTTLTEVLAGLAIGGTGGAVLGLLLGRSALLAVIFRPIIVGLYSVPLITLAPVLLLFFGLEMSPKIILVSLVVFFLLFFNTFSGAQAVDGDIVDSLKLMGASGVERLGKVIAP